MPSNGTEVVALKHPLSFIADSGRPCCGGGFCFCRQCKKGRPSGHPRHCVSESKNSKVDGAVTKKDALLRRLRQRANNGGLELFSPTVLQVFDVLILAWRGRHCYVGFRNNAEPNRHSWTVLMRRAAPRRMNGRLRGPFRRWRPGDGNDRQPGLRW